MDYRVPFHRAPSDRKTRDFEEQLLERRQKEMDKARERNARVRYDESNGYTTVYPRRAPSDRKTPDFDEQLLERRQKEMDKARVWYDESNGYATVRPRDAAMRVGEARRLRESNGHATVRSSRADDAATARRLHEQFRHEQMESLAERARVRHEQMESLTEQARGLQIHTHQDDIETRLHGLSRRHGLSYRDTKQTTERVHLNRTLREKGLREKKIKGNGNCQFRAVADQLWGDEEKYNDVKLCAIHDLETNHSRDPEFMWPASEDDGYIDRLKRNGTYGDDLTLHAIANDMGIRIIVISDHAHENVKYVEPEDKNRITNTIMLGYWGEGRGDHYTSIVEMPGR